MNTQIVASVAAHLNVSPNQIKSISELRYVWCVVVHGRRGRFVSKRIKMVEQQKTFSVAAAEALGSRWQRHGMDRIYFEQTFIKELMGLSNSKYRQLSDSKFYYDVDADEFVWRRTDSVNGVEGWDEAIKERCMVTVAEKPAKAQRCCCQCGATHLLMGGSLGLLCPDCYDDVEGGL